ncbi:MAG: hypothetical protein HOP27_07480 [Anaerolineales bacterium]|jgi:hypothetical protein|nr:hypothetical protein [Anaerolineales bacterium]
MMKSIFKSKVSVSKLKSLAAHYPVDYDHEIENVLAPQVRERGYFTKAEFEQICYWKTPRSRSKVASNSAEYIEAVTRTVFTTTSEQLRIEALTLLNGVSWPTASVILHFCHQDPYPILDFRALWSLGVEADKVNYNFHLWWDYTQACRKLAKDTGLSMRELDRALWQYSKENQ